MGGFLLCFFSWAFIWLEAYFSWHLFWAFISDVKTLYVSALILMQFPGSKSPNKHIRMGNFVCCFHLHLWLSPVFISHWEHAGLKSFPCHLYERQMVLHIKMWTMNMFSYKEKEKKSSILLMHCIHALQVTKPVMKLSAFLILTCLKQTYLQSTTTRLEEMRVRRRDAEQWMSHRLLPESLRERIRRYEQYKWQETRGVDEENLVRNLPKDLRRDIKRHLCLSLLMRVRISLFSIFIVSSDK